MNAPTLSRRSFLFNLAVISAASFLAAPARAFTGIATERRLNFFHTHTREKLDIVYFSSGNYLPDALLEITHFFRDHRTDETHPIDPALFDILHAVSESCPGKGCFEVISGYRSPATNAMLRKRRGGVARQSLHMQGKAVDVRYTNLSTKVLRDLAVASGQGGVGYYKYSDFVHIDTGTVRTW